MAEYSCFKFHRDELFDRYGYVYLIDCPATRLVKVGFSIQPEKRVRNLQTASGTHLRLVSSLPGYRSDEQHIHWVLEYARGIGEWFAITDSTSAQLRSWFHVADDIAREWASWVEEKNAERKKRREKERPVVSVPDIADRNYRNMLPDSVPAVDPDYSMNEYLTGAEFCRKYGIDYAAASLAASCTAIVRDGVYKAERRTKQVYAYTKKTTGERKFADHVAWPEWLWLLAWHFKQVLAS